MTNGGWSVVMWRRNVSLWYAGYRDMFRLLSYTPLLIRMENIIRIEYETLKLFMLIEQYFATHTPRHKGRYLVLLFHFIITLVCCSWNKIMSDPCDLTTLYIIATTLYFCQWYAHVTVASISLICIPYLSMADAKKKLFGLKYTAWNHLANSQIISDSSNIDFQWESIE